MSNLNSWEDDPAAQDENLSRQAQQQLNMNPQQGGGQFRPSVASFQPTANTFQPGQTYSGGYAPQYQQQNYQGQQQGQQQGYYQQYQQGYNQYNQSYGGGGYAQGYNNQQGYGRFSLLSLIRNVSFSSS